jgi:hypothetical protein
LIQAITTKQDLRDLFGLKFLLRFTPDVQGKTTLIAIRLLQIRSWIMPNTLVHLN